MFHRLESIKNLLPDSHAATQDNYADLQDNHAHAALQDNHADAQDNCANMLNCKINSTNGGTFCKSSASLFLVFFLVQGVMNNLLFSLHLLSTIIGFGIV